MKRGDNVTTFTGRTGRVVQMLPERRVAVNVLLHPKGDGQHPIRIDMIYDRADVQPRGGEAAAHD